MPDAAAIDSHVKRADFILVTHTHYDHVLDVPHLALTTKATVIGTESTENVLRTYRVPEEQLITVRGGEGYDFGVFSVKVIPSLHTALDQKHYFSSATSGSHIQEVLRLLFHLSPQIAKVRLRIRDHNVSTSDILIKESEDIGLPFSDSRVHEVVPIVGRFTDRRINLQNVRLSEPRQFVSHRFAGCGGIVIRRVKQHERNGCLAHCRQHALAYFGRALPRTSSS